MQMPFIPANALERLLNLLRQEGELHAPQRGDDGAVRFAPLQPGALPDLTAVRTLLPPKKYLLQPEETILTCRAGPDYRATEIKPQQLILFGVHPCDLAAIHYLDLVFLGTDPDPTYSARRAALTLIGTSCTPDQFCSCHSHPSPLKASCDLFLQQTDDGFAVSSASPRGARLLVLLDELIEVRELTLPEDSRRFFDSPDRPASHTNSRSEMISRRRGLRARGVQIRTLSGRRRANEERALMCNWNQAELDPSLPDWQELAQHCLGCGACSICCPTCYCFDVLEFGGLDGNSAKRLRRWDNCLFKSHSEVAGGATFQKDKAQRFRYRYRHKYRGFGPLRGIPACVGCGRCRAACPAGLDLRSLAEKLERGDR